MPSPCVVCRTPVDALRHPARIVDGRVVVKCRACAGLATPSAEVATVTCGFCATTVATWRSEAVVVAGTIKVRCRSCRDAPAEVSAPPGVAVVAPVGRPRERPARRWPVVAFGVAVTVAASFYAWVGRGSTLEASAAASLSTSVVRIAPVFVPVYLPIVAQPPATRVTPAVDPPIPSGATIHPLPGADRVLPGTSSGSFGAERSGDRPIECGAGHCGVDLVADIGTPILAARAGIVESVHRDASGRGGRWLKIEHRGDVATLYFHLDEIRADLDTGSHVEAGELIGTLGRTGVLTSPTHVHFAVTVGGAYVDPLPMVRSARVVAGPASRRVATAR